MLYKGRKVEYVRDAAKSDPYYDPEYNQVIVFYLDGEGYETVKEDQLDGWDAKERKGHLADAEKQQAADLEVARRNAEKARIDSDSSVAPKPAQTRPVEAKPAPANKAPSQLNTKK